MSQKNRLWISSIFILSLFSCSHASAASIPILMYHHVGEVPINQLHDPIRQDLTVSPAQFEDELGWLQKKDYHTISFEKMVAFARGDKPDLPQNPVVLTFDDGYEDAYTNALPLLEKYNMHAAFAIITGKVGTPGYLTWEEIKAMASQGMEFLSHTVSHPDLRTLSNRALQSELADSKTTLEEKLGTPIDYFVYPSGEFSVRVQKAVAAAGYLAARSTKAGKVTRNSPLDALPVVRIHGSLDGRRFARLMGS